jgi:LEA14-like dessication related protein
VKGGKFMKKLLIILPVLSLLLSSCALFTAPKFERVHSVKLLELTADQTRLNLSLVISNPNSYAIGLKTMQVTVMDKNRDKLGIIELAEPVSIVKNAADTLYLEINLETRRVTKLISHEASSLDLIIRAEAVAKAFGITKKLTIEQKQQINLTEILEKALPEIPGQIKIPTISARAKNPKSQVVILPDNNSSPLEKGLFQVIKTKITDVGLKETELTVSFTMLNPYGIAFTLIDFPAEIWINDRYAGKGMLQKPIRFSEDVAKNEGALVFTLNNYNSLLTASKALLKKDLSYRVEGTLKAAGFGTTIEKQFRFSGLVDMDGKPEQ